MEKRKILIAEDDADDQQFLHDFLKARADIILLPIATNGVELLHCLEQIQEPAAFPDVIILDQNMPKKNGLQTLQHLKDDRRYAHIPVIIYSTYTDDQLIKNGEKYGACLVVPKPVSKEGYDLMITTVFDNCI